MLLRRRRSRPPQSRERRVGILLAALALTAAAVAAVPALAFQTQVEPFVIEPPLEPGSPYEYEPILSVADRVPRTDNPGQQVQMVTIPDGLGALPDRRGEDLVARRSDFALFMNQEHNKTEDQQFVIGEPEYQGAIITLLQMSERRGELEVDSGDLAYERVFDTLTGESHPPARAGDLDQAFGRFCSGYLAYDYEKFGFDRPIYFAGEESSTTFGPQETYYETLGGTATATFADDGERQLHTLPDLGHYQFENIVPIPGYRGKTVLMGLEDGPSGYVSQLYMYVGEQDRRSDDPMERNGLVGGQLYVLSLPSDPDERSFESGRREGEWVEVPDARTTPDAALEAYAQSINAFDHFRVEDGDSRRRQLVYDSTGGDQSAPQPSTLVTDHPGNFYGRLYALRLDERDPTSDSRLSLEYDADEAVATSEAPNFRRGNALVSLDNLTLSPRGYLLVQEDATGYGDDFMREKQRDAQVWRFRLTGDRDERLGVDEDSGRPVGEVNCIHDGGRDNVCPGNGVWETSGIIDTDHVIGSNTFLLDVEAHQEPPPFPHEPDYGDPNEDGQLGVFWPADDDGEDRDDGDDGDDD